ncbi:hypothetical protein A2263_02300 [Candidatus Peregrinibacteria bacterium RIFOXYA2_FULL_33_21]|nr:MAG: hypothetical protein A2263_02300 [Candidatus Peregrinibacteria bacterium RIFOXYA2_FULL_33_21]
MKKLTIYFKIDMPSFPAFGIYKWKENDYKVPLTFEIDNTKVRLFLENALSSLNAEPNMSYGGFVEIEIENPTSDLIKSLQNSKELAFEIAQKIYYIYEKTIERFEILCRTTGQIKNLITHPNISFGEFFNAINIFGSTRYPVQWQIDSEGKKDFQFSIKTRRGKNALFKQPQLLTPNKWKKMQKTLERNIFVQKEIVEILRIQSKILWNDKKIPTLEIAILLETLLRDYSKSMLLKKGFSNNKIKDLSEELTFNNLLNLVLPLCLTKSQLKNLQDSINKVNRLRKIRNDLVHGNIREKDINIEVVKEGIKGGLKITKFLV